MHHKAVIFRQINYLYLPNITLAEATKSKIPICGDCTCDPYIVSLRQNKKNI